MDLMETDTPNEGGERILRVNGNDIPLRPVSPDDSGEGLPYAPENWPEPGDIWKWKVGKRIASNGHYLDRYLYLPTRLSRLENPPRKRLGFASKLSVERFVRTNFPHADINAFFASFSWKIPSRRRLSVNGNSGRRTLFLAPPVEMEEHSGSDSQSEVVRCRARNTMCSSLVVQDDDSSRNALPCDICCREPRFCRDCCCILCSKTVDLDHGGYSFIKCEALVSDGYICGHIAHIDCARRCYMAGVVGGIIGLDAEYCCRRCDSKMDLVPHVTKFIKTCESVDSVDVIEKILNLGISILHDSRKPSAKGLLRRMELALEKLKRGMSLEDIWKIEDSDLTVSTDISHDRNTALEMTNLQDTGPNKRYEPITPMATNHQSESVKLEKEVDQVLQDLRNSQEKEYRIAKEKLYEQMNRLCNLYQQLDKERSELALRPPKVDPDELLNAVLNRVAEIKKELGILNDMKEVANGFGKTSKAILKDCFGLQIDK